MTCKVALCAVCRLAGLEGCPERGAPLPLASGPVVETRRPKLIYVPPGASWEDAERIIDKFYGPRK